MSRCVLALDQGTTSSRAILFDRLGRPLACAQEEFKQHFPQPGWVEHDAGDLWETTRRTAQSVLRRAGVRARDVAAVGIANQRETTLLWDRRTGRPVHRAIVWQDRRTAGACATLERSGRGPLFRRRTGLLLDPYFSGTKLAWLLDHVPGARRRAGRGELAFGTVDTWLLWKLTGGHVHATDVSNASRTLLAGLATGDWDAELARILHIPIEVLPQVRPSSGVFGEITAIPELRGVPVAGIAGDQQAALFGQGCFRAGMAKNTYGTGCFMLMNTGSRPVVSRNRLLTTIAWRLGGRLEYALEGSVFVGGAVVQWLRDGLGLIARSADVEALAARVPDNGGVAIVPAFAGLGAPYWDPGARGAIVGVTRGTTAAHLARAALESIAFQTSDLIGAMEADSGRRIRELRVDGGASVNNALMQFQSDLIRAAVVRPRVTETTALGAAALAGLAVGVWKDKAEVADLAGADRTFHPAGTRAGLAALRQGWSRAVGAARHWASPEA
ncbi:MAG TPA: glycerol kinase GlpK [Opitutaceae bacterium]|jgi:glycerol kinase